MNEIFTWSLIFAFGVLMGGFFFGGLWWTVQKGVSIQRPGFWFLASLLLRVGITLGGFFLIARGHWGRILLCLIGFLAARFIVMRLTDGIEKPVNLTREAGHAPYTR